MKLKTREYRCSFWIGLVLLAGCASAPQVSVDVAQVQQQFKGKSVEQALEETQAEMSRAEQDNLAFYSPGFFSVAKQALDEARFLKLAPKDAATDGASTDTQIFTKLALADKSLAQARATKPEAQKRLGNILKVHQSLIAKGIDKSAANEYSDLMGELDSLFRRIEKNDLEGFEQAKKITFRQFRRLEAQSVKAVQLDNIMSVLAQAEANGAGGAAPKSHKKTLQALKNAQAVIESDPNNMAAIKDAVARFAFEANHLVHITNEVKELRALNRTAMENILLSVESHLLAISDALHQPDPRQENLRKQVELTVQAADQLFAAKDKGGTRVRTRHVNKNELESAQSKIDQLQAQLRDMQQKNAQLKRDEKPLNKRIEALERVVIKLNNEKAELENELAKMMKQSASPAEGVEITPVNK